jgi:hypothetical protein
MRCGIVFEALRNHANRIRSIIADGLVVNCYAEQQDFIDGKYLAYLLSKNEVLIKQPLMPHPAVHGHYSRVFVQSYHSCISYMMEAHQEHRQAHYVLFKFPPSYQLENLYSRATTSSKIDASFAWYGVPSKPVLEGVSVVQWPLALTNTKQRIMVTDSLGAETAEARAAREAWERAAGATPSAPPGPGPAPSGGRGGPT